MEKEIKKPSPGSELLKLGHLSVLIVDVDIRSAQQTRVVLSTFGVTKTHLLRDTREALEYIQEKSIDVLILDWNTHPMDGIELARFLRQSPESPNRLLPIILTASRTDLESIRVAVNSGVNEYLNKPFNSRSLQARLLGIIDAPRTFVVSEAFIGPCRRRTGSPPPGVLERREERPEQIIISRDKWDGTVTDNRPRIIMPDFSLKKKLETVPAAMAGLEQVLSKGQAAKQEEDYMQWVLKDIATMKQAHKNLSLGPEYAITYVERISTAALSIRARAMSFGYILGAKVAAQLNDFCRKFYRRDNPTHPLIIEKHIETLSAIFTARLRSDGGEIGQELFDELVQLVKRYI